MITCLLVAKLGIDEFKRLVMEEREILPYDERWTSYINELPAYGEKVKKKPSEFIKEYDDWLVKSQDKFIFSLFCYAKMLNKCWY